MIILISKVSEVQIFIRISPRTPASDLAWMEEVLTWNQFICVYNIILGPGKFSQNSYHWFKNIMDRIFNKTIKWVKIEQENHRDKCFLGIQIV